MVDSAGPSTGAAMTPIAAVKATRAVVKETMVDKLSKVLYKRSEDVKKWS
jgi:hypothetical protein